MIDPKMLIPYSVFLDPVGAERWSTEARAQRSRWRSLDRPGMTRAIASSALVANGRAGTRFGLATARALEG
ncbi:hypothetical protein [Methylorubrum aminovorans]|uniref:hypothetical protein n=1 Tax=Methylorubrum aminovorans TaxID=269069 RepID=UPI003C304162